jgi:hypothetical protein
MLHRSYKCHSRIGSEEKIIERADKKLFLDAAVIQQGRLAEQNS